MMPAQREPIQILYQGGVAFISPSAAETRSVDAKYDFLHLFPHVVDRATERHLQGISY